ncbi:MAG: hypothetical protein H0V72_19995 [Bradyrhizobium sp.]|nr:hypothetical protein [Bradyrhizobium sp.]
MEVTLRGWHRDMGTKHLTTVDLTTVPPVTDARKSVKFNSVSIFKGFMEVGIHWRQNMSYTGNYRMEVNLSYDDIVHLFKAWNGAELDVNLIDHHGFTVSPELRKRLLGEIKLADLTIGDLAGIASKKEEVSTAEIKPFPRRF